jgi:hypothetical protein
MADERSVWFYIAWSCGGLVLLGGAVLAGLGFWAFRAAKTFEAELKDPVIRTEKVKKMLGAERLPEGYHAMMSFSVPLVMDTAILSSEEQNSGGTIDDLGERGLLYFEMISLGQDEQELRDYFEGKTNDSRVLRKNKIHIDVDEVIRRGVIPRDDHTLMYMAQRGSVSAQGQSGDGIMSVVLVDCPDDNRTRTAIWFAPDPSPSTELEDLDLTGTPADELAITEFFGHFKLCG